MQGVTAKFAMNHETEAVQIDLPLIELMSIFSSTHFHALPVIKNENELVGLITIKELDKVRKEKSIESINYNTLFIKIPYSYMFSKLS